jgi:L-seryl-tRNA(Ser) seleniumtransferase
MGPISGMQTPKGLEDSDFRRIPSVGALLEHPVFAALLARAGAGLVTSLIREDLDEVRANLDRGAIPSLALSGRVAPEAVASRVAAAAGHLLAPAPRRVINATGVIVHTNLGRAVLSREAAAAVAEAASSYLDLEYDLARGARGRRITHLAPLLARLFPGATAFVVNNNAAAVLLALRALARGKEVVVSRGELWRSAAASGCPRSWPLRARACARWGRPTARACPTTPTP